ncbi:hypothetical protein GF406_07260 [candidate division KSB1 bacterium]|nr:hypothetical protein [candidate division KSB1 bacterium]
MSSRSISLVIIILMVLHGLLHTAPADVMAPEDSLEIISVANAGFYLRIGDQALVIDALFDNESPKRPGILPPPPSEYENPSLETLDALYSGQKPFKPISLALVTHVDVDHFTAPEVIKFLSQNTIAKLCCPRQVAEKIGGRGFDPRSQIIQMDPGLGKRVRHVSDSMVITAYGMNHSGNRLQTSNIAYLIEWHGLRILHLGDAGGEKVNFSRFGDQWPKVLDIVFVPYWYFNSLEKLQIIRHYLSAKILIPVHMRKNERTLLQKRHIDLESSRLYVFPSQGDKRLLDIHTVR